MFEQSVKVHHYWVGSSADNDELKPFFYHQQELTTEQGCIMWGLRVIIPPVYRHQALQELDPQKSSGYCEDEVSCKTTCVVAKYR